MPWENYELSLNLKIPWLSKFQDEIDKPGKSLKILRCQICFCHKQKYAEKLEAREQDFRFFPRKITFLKFQPANNLHSRAETMSDTAQMTK